MSKEKALSVVGGTELSPIEKSEKVGAVVAVQLKTDLIVYDTEDADIVSLKEQYKDLKGDTTEGYEAVVKAIADCRTRRTTIEKQKAIYKRPALDWNAEAEKRAKEIVGKIQEIEDPLKAEKDRVDSIKAEEKRAREEARLRTLKNQQDNLNKVRQLATNLFELNMEQLQAELKSLNDYDLESIDFGDYLMDANIELDRAIIRVENAIAAENQRLEVEAEKERIRKEREEHAARERELDAAKARLAEWESKQSTAPAEPVSQQDIIEQRVSSQCSPIRNVKRDKAALEKFITQLAAVSFGAPGLENEEAQDAVDKVVAAVEKAVVFLTNIKNKL